MAPTLAAALIVLLSLLSLLAGPLLYGGARRSRFLLAAMDGFVLVSVGGLVLLHILPSSFRDGGVLTTLWIGLGLLAPGIFEHLSHRGAQGVHRAAICLALVALLAHTLVDGVAIGSVRGHLEEALPAALAVAIHQLPINIAIWVLIRPRYGVRAACAVLALVAIGTLIGFAGGAGLMHHLELQSFAWFQAFVAGNVIHVLFHSHGLHEHGHHEHRHHEHGHHEHRHHEEAVAARPSALVAIRRALPENLGALAGVLMVVLVSLVERVSEQLGHGHHEHAHDHGTTGIWLERTLELGLRAAPVLLFGYLLASGLDQLQQRSMTRSHRPEVYRGVLLSITRSLSSEQALISLRQPRLGVAERVAALVAPLLALEALVVALVFLGEQLAFAYGAFGLVFAVGAGLFWQRRASQVEGDHASVDGEAAPGVPTSGLMALVERTAAWSLFGLMAAALASGGELSAWLGAVPVWVQVLALTIAGAVLHLPALASVLMGAGLLHAGVSAGAVLAFVLTVPLWLPCLHRELRPWLGVRLSLWLTLAGPVLAFVSGLIFVALVREPSPTLLGEVRGHLHSVADALRASTGFEQASSVVLLALFAWSLLRQGPRRWLGTVAASGHGPVHEHHGHGAGPASSGAAHAHGDHRHGQSAGE